MAVFYMFIFRRGELPWWCGKFWLAERRKPGTISSSGPREEVRSMLSCQKKKKRKKKDDDYAVKKHIADLRCHIFWWRLRQHVIFTEFRGSDKGWIHASALKEHQASSSETSSTVTLCQCDFLTPQPLLLSVSLSQTHLYTYSFQTLTCEIDFYISIQTNKQTNTSVTSRAQTYQLWHIFYSLTHLEINTRTVKLLTHCLIWSSLEQEICRREREEEKSQTMFKSSLFQEKGERGNIASRNCSWSEVFSCACMHIHTLAAPLCASKTSINAQSKIYSSEKQQPKAFQGRQLGCRACGLTEEACRLQLELTSWDTTI